MYSKASYFYFLFLLSLFSIGCHSKINNAPEVVEKIWQPLNSYTTYKNDWGDRKKITLPDQSVVILNSSATITAPTDFGNPTRELLLDGDAYFSIKHIPAKPLIIHTKHLLIYCSNGEYRITASFANEGESVEVLNGSLIATKAYASQFPESDTLKAGEMVMINHTIDLMEKETCDLGELAKWKSNVLSFTNADMNNVAKTLENWFNISIELNGDFSTIAPITSTFQNATLPEILKTVSSSAHFKYNLIEKENKVILIPN